VARDIDASLRLFEQVGDEAGQTLAWRLRSGMSMFAGRWSEAAAAAERVIEHARLAGDARAETRAAMNYAIASVYGSTPVPEAIAQCEELARASARDQIALVTINLQLAQLYAMRGAFERARQLSAGVRAKLEDLHAGLAAVRTSLEISRVESLAGDHAAAERELRHDYDALTAIGERYSLYTVAGLLARAVYAQGRLEEAEALAQVVKDGAASDDSDAQALWRSMMARVLAARGDVDGALPLAHAAVEIRRQTDSPVDLAEAHEDLAEVLRAAGQPAEADAALGAALELARRKGDGVTAARLLAQRASLGAMKNA
jgi:tetratricopeptide (TPR) repeat protein